MFRDRGLSSAGKSDTPVQSNFNGRQGAELRPQMAMRYPSIAGVILHCELPPGRMD
jgi:hypothetical protein